MARSGARFRKSYSNSSTVSAVPYFGMHAAGFVPPAAFRNRPRWKRIITAAKSRSKDKHPITMPQLSFSKEPTDE